MWPNLVPLCLSKECEANQVCINSKLLWDFLFQYKLLRKDIVSMYTYSLRNTYIGT